MSKCKRINFGEKCGNYGLSASSPYGNAVSNLQVAARECPVMGAARAVQSSRSYATSTKLYTSSSRRHRTLTRRALTPLMRRLAFRYFKGYVVVTTLFATYFHGLAVIKAAQAATAETADITPAASTTSCPVKRQSNGFNYEEFYHAELTKKHKDKSYRYVNNSNRLAMEFPKAHAASEEERVTVWCSNDYLGMSKNKEVLTTMHNTLDKYGASISVDDRLS
ncbi:hypothetical protein V1524DRAFT_411824 [Lipomyces starkeyi]